MIFVQNFINLDEKNGCWMKGLYTKDVQQQAVTDGVKQLTVDDLFYVEKKGPQ